MFWLQLLEADGNNHSVFDPIRQAIKKDLDDSRFINKVEDLIKRELY